MSISTSLLLDLMRAPRWRLVMLSLSFAWMAACSNGAPAVAPPPTSTKIKSADDNVETQVASKKTARPAPTASPSPTPSPTPSTQTVVESSPPAKAPAALRSIYRLFGTEHLFSPSATEGAPVFHLEGEAFKVLPEEVAGSVNLQRCLAGKAHFVSIDEHCEGQVHDGVFFVLGYIMTTTQANTQPVYRCASSDLKDWVLTVNPGECTAAGYSTPTALGFAPTPGFIAPD